MADVTSSREPCAINPEFRFVGRRCAHRWEGRERMGCIGRLGLTCIHYPRCNRKLLYSAGSSAQCSVMTWRDGTDGGGREAREGGSTCVQTAG